MTNYYMHACNLNIRLANFLHMIPVMQLLFYYFKRCMIAVLAIAVVCRAGAVEQAKECGGQASCK